MHSPPPPTTATSTTYTTPSGSYVSRSIENLSSYISSRRPLSEFLSLKSFDPPDSLSIVGDRIQRNKTYFRNNYFILVLSSTCLSLIGSPIFMIVFALILTLWFVLYFFREDPLFVSEEFVLAGLTFLSILSIWFMGILGNLILGVWCGMVLVMIHVVWRNPDGLVLDEDEAVSSGLIVPRSVL